MTTRFAIIVAGGTGSRMESEVPKQFMLLAGKPVLMHSIEKFYQVHARIVVVLNETLFTQWQLLCENHHFTIPHQLTPGGPTRSQSVFNGLHEVVPYASSGNTVVAVHDAARPLVSVQLIEKLFAACDEKDNAVPAIKVAESLRRISPTGNAVINRDEIVMIQTPQCFHFDKLFGAYQKSGARDFTDDASVFEKAGYSIQLLEGERNNFKITVAGDLPIAEAIINI